MQLDRLGLVPDYTEKMGVIVELMAKAGEDASLNSKAVDRIRALVEFEASCKGVGNFALNNDSPKWSRAIQRIEDAGGRRRG